MNTTSVPLCIGVIMDGNRRYAKALGLPQIEGHRLGYEKVKEVGQWARDAGIKYMILYAFSTENWKRSPDEVAYLSDIFRTLLFTEAEALQKDNIAVQCVGDLDRFGTEIADKARDIDLHNPTNPSHTIIIALSYGGRLEILTAVNKLIASDSGPVTEEQFADALWTRGVPDPDLIIRVGGEKRLSNFLLWQSAYSELFFIDTFWPAFTHQEFTQILDEYATRERRHGK